VGNEPTVQADRPQNGLAGLKHWRSDLRSGFMVAMISLPFSMGIAITSGAPPVCGIMSAIIAGLILPFLGGSYVTISGPAAGLAPVLFAGMILLGGTMIGSEASQSELLRTGYPLLLVAICLAGLAQVILARLKVARLSAIFPSAAIEGMLASIGLLIIVKQIPLFMGVPFQAHEFWEMLEEIPEHIGGMNWGVFGLSLGSLALLFLLNALPGRVFKVMPPPVWVFLGGTLVSTLLLGLDRKFLINVPESPLQHGIVLPDFATVFAHSALWLPTGYIVFVLLLIDGTESLATIMAVDKIDPFKRRSDPDRTLFAMGASNVCSSMLGGLTIIPGIVKSTANILGGGRTQWANFYNACFLLTFLCFARDLINLVPLAVLASILVFIGFKLCRPKVWRHVAHVGTEQFCIFAATVAVTVSTDLLIGITVGIALKLVACLWYSWQGSLSSVIGLFRSPVATRRQNENAYHISFDRPLVCFNLLHLLREWGRVPEGARDIYLHLTDGVTLIDHTSCFNLFSFVEEYEQTGRGKVEILGLDRLEMRSDYETCMRVRPATVSVGEIPPVVQPASSDHLDLGLARVEGNVRTPQDDLGRIGLVPDTQGGPGYDQPGWKCLL
jgi:carbonic anhydrase